MTTKIGLLLVCASIFYQYVCCDETVVNSNPLVDVVKTEDLLKIINEVNSRNDSTWTAGINFDVEEISISNLLGSLDLDYESSQKLDIVDVPPCQEQTESKHKSSNKFDARKAWPHCTSIGKVPNQGKCASDWVISPVSVITDRMCIETKKTDYQASAHEPLSCCKSCGRGCKSGYPGTVFSRFVKKGLPSGGDYNSKKGCQPYEIKPCKKYKECFTKHPQKTPACKPYCYNKNHKTQYEKDLKKGYQAFRMSCCCAMASEIKKRGPISATMVVFEDFLTYKSGIYQHVSGKKLGKVTVKLIGFDDTTEPRHWIAINSWGKTWGNKGTFKIARSKNECLIEGASHGVWIKKIK